VILLPNSQIHTAVAPSSAVYHSLAVVVILQHIASLKVTQHPIPASTSGTTLKMRLWISSLSTAYLGIPEEASQAQMRTIPSGHSGYWMILINFASV